MVLCSEKLPWNLLVMQLIWCLMWPASQKNLPMYDQSYFSYRVMDGQELSSLLNNSIIFMLKWVRFLWKLFVMVLDGNIIGLVGRVFTNGPGDLGSIPGCVIPKTLKMVLDASLFNTQQYKVCIRGKVEQSRERSSAFPYTLV